MGQVYEKVYANHPEAIMMWMTKGNTADSRYEVTDPLTDYNGVLLNYGEKPEVVNYFASDEYKELVNNGEGRLGLMEKKNSRLAKFKYWLPVFIMMLPRLLYLFFCVY